MKSEMRGAISLMKREPLKTPYVPDARLHVVHPFGLGQTMAEIMGGGRLPDARDIVLFTLDGHQRHALNRARVHAPAPVHQLALRQRMLDEHGLDGLQIERRVQIHDGQIFVIEFAMLLGRIAIALDQMAEQVLMGVDVPIPGSWS